MTLPPGFLVAAPRSGSGKTTLTLGLLAAWRARGRVVQPFKCGPDYIDPAFHTAAAGRASLNLDSWGMPRALVAAALGHASGADLVVAEGSMGLFDGVAAPGAWGTGQSADIAALCGWPVVLVVDASGAAQSLGATALGFARFRDDVRIAGVVLNRVASDRHARLARAGLAAAGLPCLGALPKDTGLILPERHLGLVQAGEQEDLAERLSALAAFTADHLDIDALAAVASPTTPPPDAPALPRPPAQRIALAQDAAFSFAYPHLVAGWRAAGAEILPFSPLADEGPDPSADLCWLPGGYPELHAGRLAAAERFRAALRDFAANRPVHGECGGYMALGAGLVDADGVRHRMAGLLGLETSYAARRFHLGYRVATLRTPMPGAAAGGVLRGHEFHYSSILAQPDPPLARVVDATGAEMPETGSRRGNVTGTFFHLISGAS